MLISQGITIAFGLWLKRWQVNPYRGIGIATPTALHGMRLMYETVHVKSHTGTISIRIDLYISSESSGNNPNHIDPVRAWVNERQVDK